MLSNESLFVRCCN